MQSMIMLFFAFYIDFYIFTIFQYGAYDSHKQIFNIIFKMELKVCEDDIPILNCCNNETFIKCFFLVFKRVLSLLNVC